MTEGLASERHSGGPWPSRGRTANTSLHRTHLGSGPAPVHQQRSHFESLDNKAGIAVGFAGAIGALASGVEPVLAKLGVVAAVVAG
jgi:hypothetical protein